MYRIFLVEDDETIAKLVRRHLEKWDYDVHVVQKFDAVMSEFASFDPHLVLMDIGLPFYNGYHWCTEIRRSAHAVVSSVFTLIICPETVSFALKEYCCPGFNVTGLC